MSYTRREEAAAAAAAVVVPFTKKRNEWVQDGFNISTAVFFPFVHKSRKRNDLEKRRPCVYSRIKWKDVNGVRLRYFKSNKMASHQTGILL